VKTAFERRIKCIKSATYRLIPWSRVYICDRISRLRISRRAGSLKHLDTLSHLRSCISLRLRLHKHSERIAE